ncbi:MAG TPA: cytochrome c3 family protein [Anaeromyxobacteraceae bacterium]|jgi:hypothetical protein|nr:cytochrome c3 family protein [Anaeromyxobacteraceae bacterium]
MSALFRPRANTFFRIALVVILGGAAGTVGGMMLYARTPFGTRQFAELQQPIQFDHRHHVTDDNIDCRYCHQTVERSNTAGIPATSLCMNCHSQIWNRSPLLDKVRESYFTGRTIEWMRVHRLPDFVYFNHSIHVNKGIGCETCHGRVDQMPAIQQVAPLTMQWCLDCHRDPAPHLRPREAVTEMDYRPEKDQAVLGPELARKYDVHSRTSCTTCHR